MTRLPAPPTTAAPPSVKRIRPRATHASGGFAGGERPAGSGIALSAGKRRALRQPDRARNAAFRRAAERRRRDRRCAAPRTGRHREGNSAAAGEAAAVEYALCVAGARRAQRDRAPDDPASRRRRAGHDAPYLDLYYGYLNVNAPAIGKSILSDYEYAQLMSRLQSGEHALFIVRGTKFSAAYPWKFAFLGHRSDKQTGAKTFSTVASPYGLPGEVLAGGPSARRRRRARVAGARRGRASASKSPSSSVFVGRTLAVVLFFATRALGAPREARRQALGVLAEDRELADRDRLRRRLLDGAAIDHAGADARSFACERLKLGAVPVRSAHLRLLDRDRRDGDRLGPRSLLRLDVPVRFALRAHLQDRACDGPAEVAAQAARAVAQPTAQAQVRGVRHAARRVVLCDAVGREARQNRAVQDDLRRRRSQPRLAVRAVLDLRRRRIDLRRAAVLQVSVPARREPRAARALADLQAARQAGMHDLPCVRGRLRVASDRSRRPDRSDECLLCLDCMVMYYDEQSCPPLSKERKHRERAGLPLSPVGKDGRYIPIEQI